MLFKEFWKLMLMINIVGSLNKNMEDNHQNTLVNCITIFSKMFFADVHNIFFSSPIDNIDVQSHSSFGTLHKEVNFTFSPIPQCSKPDKKIKILTLNVSLMNTFKDIQLNDQLLLHVNIHINTSSAGNIENFLLQKLNNEHKWSFIVSLVNNKHNQINLESIHGYVMILKEQNSEENKLDINNIFKQIYVLHTNNLFNNWTKILIVIVGTFEINEIHNCATQIFHYLNSIKIKNAKIAFQNASGAMTILTGLPYDSPSEECSDRLKITAFATCDPEGYELSYLKVAHFNRLNTRSQCPIMLQIPTENPPLIICSNKSDELNIKVYSGIFIKIMLVVSNHLRKPIQISKNPDVFFTQVHHVLYKNYYREYVYYYKLSYSWFVLKAESLSRWTSIFKVFLTNTWISLLFSLLLGAIMFRILTSIHPGKHDSHTDMGRCCLDSWSIMLGISICELPNKSSIRFFFISWIIYCLSINMIFQTYATSYFIHPGFGYQIDSYQEILDNNYELIFDSGKNFLSSQIIMAHDITMHTTLETIDSIIFFLNKPGSAMLICDDIYRSKQLQDCRNELTDIIHRIKQDKIENNEMMVIFNPLLAKSVKSIVNRLVEAGIPEKFAKETYHHKEAFDKVWRVWDLKDEYVTVSTNHLQSALLLYLVGVVFSCISFAAEIGINKLKKKDK